MMLTQEIDAPIAENEFLNMANTIGSDPHSNHMVSGTVSIQRQSTHEEEAHTAEGVSESQRAHVRDLSGADGITIF